MRIDRAWIEARIPHKGSMCLQDEVLYWDAERISCRSDTHRDLSHPLRFDGRLGAACGVEYAVQAMAVHGALAGVPGAQTPRAGYLATLRAVRLYVERLDHLSAALISNAQRIAGDPRSAVYEFELRAAASCLLAGRATVVLDAGGAVA